MTIEPVLWLALRCLGDALGSLQAEVRAQPAESALLKEQPAIQIPARIERRRFPVLRQIQRHCRAANSEPADSVEMIGLERSLSAAQGNLHRAILSNQRSQAYSQGDIGRPDNGAQDPNLLESRIRCRTCGRHSRLRH